MKIMLVYYNDLTVLLSTVFSALDFEIDYVKASTRRTLELATKHSPETWCFDTKLMLGQAIEAVQRGNDIITMPGAWGGRNENCLLGYLCKGVMKKRVENAVGKKVKLWHFNVNPVEMIFSCYFASYRNIKMLRQYSKKWSSWRVFKSLVLGIKKMKLAAKVKEKMLLSADVIDKKKLFAVYDMFISDMIFKADSRDKADYFFKKAIRSINGLERKRIKTKIRVGIVGDYAHTLFGAFPFFNIEEFLLSEDVYVEQPLSFTNYYSFLSPLYSRKNIRKLKRIFPQNVTGSDAVTLLSALYLKEKVDGLIHVGTFSCTPEEVANEVLISNKRSFPPVLSLSYDAHTNEENMRVRIEAFIDMLKNKKRK